MTKAAKAPAKTVTPANVKSAAPAAESSDSVLVRSDLAAAVHAVVGGTRNRSVMAVDIILDSICKILETESEVSINRFGAFVIRERAARNGRNPKTGETVNVPARRGVVFRPATALRTAVNGGKE